MLNQSLFLGRITQEPELKMDKNKNHFCKFQLAVQQSNSDITDFPEFICYKKIAENICKYIKRGEMIIVLAHYHSYIKDNKKYSNFVVDKVQFIDNKKFTEFNDYNDIDIPE